MVQAIVSPQTEFATNSQGSGVPVESPTHESVPPGNAACPVFNGSVLRVIILLVFAAGVLTLLATTLMPAVFVTLMLFLPALIPIILVGLGILFIEDVERFKDRLADVGEKPCSCHRDQMAAAAAPQLRPRRDFANFAS